MIEQQHESFQKLSRSNNDEIESSRQSRNSTHLLQPVNHTASTPHSELVRDPSFRTSFALKERLSTWLFNCFRCTSTEQSFVGVLDEAQRRNPASLSEQMRKLVADKILKVKICETSRLKLDPNVMHPFVKVHIVNKNTGCYLQNLEKSEEPAVYHHEVLTSYNRIERKYETNENDIILPFATACCDFRKLGNSKGIWNQKFFINYPAHLLLHPDTLLLFEILDFNHQALVYRNDEESYDRHNFYRVAWSYLRPVGMARTHLGRQQLELYTYKFSAQDDSLTKSYIPDVYYDFLWNSHEKYEGYLTVQLNYCPKPRYRFVGEEGSAPGHLFEEEQADKKYLEKYQTEEMVQREEEKPLASKELLKFYRNRQISEVPKQLVYKLESARLGCYRVKFVGNYVLAAVSERKTTSIRVYDLAEGEHVMILKGHRGVIYQMEATPNEKLLVTAGSDNIVRVLTFPQYSGEFIDEDESDAYIISECIHTAAVYSIALIHQPLQEILNILSCCYDGYLRLWQCKPSEKNAVIAKEILINDFTRSAGKVYPTYAAVGEGSYFVVGDSLGEVRIFDFSRDKLSLRCLISPEEMKNDLILCIRILSKNHLVIQASDNLIRHYELIGNKLRLSQTYTGGVYENQLPNCAVSPDNKYLLAPSHSGKPVMWDIFTGGQIGLEHLNLHLKERLVCCDWHPKYNLVALSGFVQNCPVFVFGNVLSEPEIKMVAAQIA